MQRKILSRSKPDEDDAQREIERHDRDERLRKEREILAIATDKGQFELWITETLISLGKTTRIIAQKQTEYQLKDDCVLLHSGVTGKISLFGASWKCSITTFIICFTIVKLVLHFDKAIAHFISPLVSGL